MFLKPTCISSRKGTAGGRTMAAPWHRLLSLPNLPPLQLLNFATRRLNYRHFALLFSVNGPSLRVTLKERLIQFVSPRVLLQSVTKG